MGKKACLAAAAWLLSSCVAFAADPIEVWANWPNGGEGEAFTALVDTANTQDPDAPVVKRVVPGEFSAYRQQLQIATLGGNPPPVFVFNTGLELRDASKGGQIRSIEDVWAKIDGDNIYPAGLRRLVEFDGKPWGLPITAGVISNVWYNVKLFDQLGIKVPTNWAEFDAACEKLKAAGKACLGNGSGPYWTFYNIFPSIVETAGVEGYYKIASGQIPFDGPEFSKIIDSFTMHFAENYMPNWTGGEWAAGADAVLNGDAGMDLMGSWFDAYAETRGAKPGVDFDFFPAPGFEAISIIQPDALVTSGGLDEATLASANTFLVSASTTDSQVAFNRKKGGLPANIKTPPVYTDNPVMSKMQANFSKPDATVLPNLSMMLPAKFSQDFGTAIEQYASSPSADAKAAMIASLEESRKQLLASGAFADWTK